MPNTGPRGWRADIIAQLGKQYAARQAAQTVSVDYEGERPMYLALGVSPGESVTITRRGLIDWRVEGGRAVGRATAIGLRGKSSYLFYYADGHSTPLAMGFISIPLELVAPEQVQVGPITMINGKITTQL